jgi:transglutaminase-like putative cysteine protease
VDVELVQDARRTMETGSGDCDDKVVLLCSLLCVAGFLTRFICGGQTRDIMDHVWCEVYLEQTDEWLPLDPTNERAAPGWSQAFPWRLEWEIFQ